MYMYIIIHVDIHHKLLWLKINNYYSVQLPEAGYFLVGLFQPPAASGSLYSTITTVQCYGSREGPHSLMAS